MKYSLPKNTKASTQSYRQDCHVDNGEYQFSGAHHMQGQYTDVVFFMEQMNWHSWSSNMHACQRFDSYQQYFLYLRLKQQSKPDLPRNQQHPIKRTTDSPAVAQSKAWKKCVVLFVALFCKLSSAIILSTQRRRRVIPRTPTMSNYCS